MPTAFFHYRILLPLKDGYCGRGRIDMQEFPRNIHVFIFINNLLPVSIATVFFQISILKFCMCL